jgi:photosystem II stability/assembly factor-like uncharacterized protein
LLCVTGLGAQTPSPQLFNGLRWRLIGPFRAGRVVAVGGVSGDSPKFFFGSVDGGVWKTGDEGMIWEPTFAGQPVASIGALEVAPSDPNIIYVGTGETDIRSNLASGDGAYKSVDGGATWADLGLKETRQISRVVIDPANPNVVYVGALGSVYGNSADRGVYKTTDGGATWTKVLFVNDATGIADLALAPGKPNLLFAAAWDAHRPPWSVYGPIEGPGSGLYRSQDGGATWQRLQGHGLPQGEWGRSGIAVSNDGMHVYALIDARKPGLYVSNDGGDTWELRNADLRLTGRSWYFSRITIDPQNPDVFYVPNTALYRSEDAGKTISIVRGAPGGDDYHQLWIDAEDSSRMVLGTDHGTTISVDRGKTWTSWYNQPTGQMYHVTTDDAFPYVVYGAEQDNGSIGVYSRTDHENIAPRDWFIAAQSESGYVVVDPLHKDFLFASGPNGSVVRFNKKTSLSQDITPWPGSGFGQDISQRKYRDTWTPVLVMSPFDKRALYFGTQYVMKTADGGLHWEQISPDLTGGTPQPKTLAPASVMSDSAAARGGRRATTESNPPTLANSVERGLGTIFTIAPSPLNGQLIWSGSDSGLIYLTRDGGKNWSNVTPPGVEAWSKISMIEASYFDPAEAYAAVDRHRLDDRKPYLYRTRDYGKSWTPITQGLSAPNFLRAIREDVKKKGLLFAGTEFGIEVSFDDGDHWETLQLNLPISSVRDMTIHGDDLVVATHGRAFWILDDIAPLRQAVEAEQASKPFLYQPSVAVRVDHDPFPSTRIPLDEPTAKNPPEGAMIDYYLPAPARKVTLKILDAQQKLVRQFSSDNMTPPRPRSLVVAEGWILHPEPLTGTPGMHRFVWSLTWNDSGGVDSNLPDAGAGGPPQGPRAVPGAYTVFLIVDGMELRRPLKVIMDPRSPATSQELQAQLELSQKLYAGYQQAALISADAAAALEQLLALERRNDADPALQRSASGAAGELQAIVSGVDAPTGLGLREVEAAMAADLSSVRTGDRGPTQQEQQAYHEAESSLLLRTGKWNKFRQQRLPTYSKSFSRSTDKREVEAQ